MITRAKLSLRATRVIIRIKNKNMDARATWTKLSLGVTRAIIKIKETKKRRPLYQIKKLGARGPHENVKFKCDM